MQQEQTDARKASAGAPRRGSAPGVPPPPPPPGTQSTGQAAAPSASSVELAVSPDRTQVSAEPNAQADVVEDVDMDEEEQVSGEPSPAGESARAHEDTSATVVNALHANTSSLAATRGSAPEPQPSAAAHKTKENMPSLGGLHNITQMNSEIPADVLARLLLNGETVVGQFDTFYPSPDFAPRTRIYLTFFTLGLYQVFRLIQYLMRVLKHLLCCCEGCHDPIDFRRSKVAVTSLGRVLYWRQRVRQANWPDQQVYHRVEAETRVLSVEDLAQVTLQYSDQYHCLSCCAHDYVAGVRLTFRHFDEEGTRAISQYAVVRSAQSFVAEANRLLLDTFRSKADTEGVQLGAGRPTVLVLVSNPDDHIYDGEYGLEPFEDLLKFHQHVCSLLTNVRAGGGPAPAGVSPPTLRHFALHLPNPKKATAGISQMQQQRQAQVQRGHGEARSVFMDGEVASDLAFPPTFLSARALRSSQYQQAFGDEDSANVLPGVRELHHDLSNFTLCEPDGFVNVPLRYLALHPNEEVVAAAGMRYCWSALDYLVYALSLCGVFRFNFFFNRVFNHTALVLTTHRVVEIVLSQKRGKVPTELGKMNLAIQSFFPKQVFAGSLRSVDSGRQVLASLLTCHGSLQLRLPAQHLAFAQRLQMTATRLRPLPLGCFGDLESQYMPALAHLAGGGDDSGPDPGPAADEVTSNNPAFVHKARADQQVQASWEFSALEKLLLPLLPQERVVFKHDSGERFQPLAAWLCTFFDFTPGQLNASTNLLLNCFNRVRVLECLTCGTLPRAVSASAVLTGHTLFYASLAHTRDARPAARDEIGHSEMTSRCCGAASSAFVLDDFTVVWVPVRTLGEHATHVTNSGARPLAQSMPCCRIHTRSFEARYVLLLQTSLGVVFPFAEDVRFKAWPRDLSLARFQGALGAVQTAMREEDLEDFNA